MVRAAKGGAGKGYLEEEDVPCVGLAEEKGELVGCWRSVYAAASARGIDGMRERTPAMHLDATLLPRPRILVVKLFQQPGSRSRQPPASEETLRQGAARGRTSVAGRRARRGGSHRSSRGRGVRRGRGRGALSPRDTILSAGAPSRRGSGLYGRTVHEEMRRESAFRVE